MGVSGAPNGAGWVALSVLSCDCGADWLDLCVRLRSHSSLPGVHDSHLDCAHDHPLLTILHRVDGTILEFWVLRFPFAVHAGWITAASALNVNVQVVSMSFTPDKQLAVAIISLAVLHAISVWVLFNIPRPNWSMACVLSWAFGWIYQELGEAGETIQSNFSPDTIAGVAYAAIAVCFIILIQIVVRLGFLTRPSMNPYKKVTEEDTVDDSAEQVQE